ncbi:conserved hypothetical protein [Bosea sp. 62]|uniref:DUF2184 domain-containing protein n=1 Tax=unclassified Bosea (in: a-proteobacteria) TaxID=2653178 RepID=UPI001254C462|nr:MULTISPECIES: DUF2184 domain-containing protein [unclassified Bosea (in: a-proteobacteria)]CAD5254330.1 conserved hypothetical protein [Bosea sp. 7B]CAD5276722.1 conserved hypothetical protein [Bosea sp. 21B]CAD5277871.1 conserved hypothetical protein [Bosea sp. 46]VVT59849.1 conserved hypothetical protein [Bosea sp. EC-HK365B]VXB45892.1 conserved hypothetical protein [Bosea sp. 62]
MSKIILPGLGAPLAAPAILKRVRFTDAATFDRATIDSAGAFVIGELERLDQTLHEPLVSFSWSRDIDLRSDVSIADEVSSFTNSTFAAIGGLTPTGKAWIGKDASAIASLALDIGKTANPLNLWAMQLGWTIPELESAQQVGRPVDSQKYSGMVLKHNMDIDEQVYIGDTDLGFTGLVNSGLITPSNVPSDGTGSSPLWANKSPTQILRDVNDTLTAAWQATGFAQVPTKLLLPPLKFAYINGQLVSSAADKSILTYLRENSLTMAQTGRPLDIQPVKWLTGRGAGATDRMVAYTQAENYVRFPMVPLQRTPLEYRDLRQLVTYFGRLGVVEFVYPETVAYRDGI